MGGSRALVTGATGMLGGALTRRLVAGGAEVHALGRRAADGLPGGVHQWQADITDPTAVGDVVATVRPDHIFHLAGHVDGARDLDLVRPTLDVNLYGTVNILNAAQRTGVARVVLTGSLLQHPPDDDALAAPTSPYSASKWAATAYARMYHALGGLPVVILRPSMVYGPGQVDANKVVPYVILSFLRGERPKLTSGRWEVDWVYVDDVVEAFTAAATTPGTDGRTIDIGSGEIASVRSVVERIRDIMETTLMPEYGARDDRPFEEAKEADIATTRELLRWTPQVRLADGLRRTVAWYSQQRGRASSPHPGGVDKGLERQSLGRA